MIDKIKKALSLAVGFIPVSLYYSVMFSPVLLAVYLILFACGIEPTSKQSFFLIALYYLLLMCFHIVKHLLSERIRRAAKEPEPQTANPFEYVPPIKKVVTPSQPNSIKKPKMIHKFFSTIGHHLLSVLVCSVLFLPVVFIISTLICELFSEVSSVAVIFIVSIVVLIFIIIYLLHRQDKLTEQNHELSRTLSKLSATDNSKFHDFLKNTPAFRSLCELSDGDIVSRVRSALQAKYSVRKADINISADILSDSGNVYHTTLYSCTCPDYQHRKQPCKHMLYLALHSGFLRSSDPPDLQDVVNELSKLYKKEQELDTKQKGIDKLIKENSQKYPWLSKLYADYFYTFDDHLANRMYSKCNPAPVSAENLRRIAKELREVRTQCKEYEYQLHYLESVFPKLKEYCKEDPIAFYESRKSKSRKG